MKSFSRYVVLLAVSGFLSGNASIAQTSGSSGTKGTVDPARSGASAISPGNNASAEVSGGANPAARTNELGGPRRTDGSASAAAQPPNAGDDVSPTPSSDVARAERAKSMRAGTAFSAGADPLVSTIQSGDYNSRAKLANEVEQRVGSQKDSIKSLKNEGKRLQGQAKSDLKLACDEVDTREKDLKRSLKELRGASAEKWDATRLEVASNYQAYMTALGRAQTQAGTGAAFPGDLKHNSSAPADHGTATTSPDSAPAPATSP